MNKSGRKEEQQLKVALKKFRLTPWQQILMLMCNYIPTLHAALVICTLCMPWAGLGFRIVAGAAVL